MLKMWNFANKHICHACVCLFVFVFMYWRASHFTSVHVQTLNPCSRVRVRTYNATWLTNKCVCCDGIQSLLPSLSRTQSLCPSLARYLQTVNYGLFTGKLTNNITYCTHCMRVARQLDKEWDEMRLNYIILLRCAHG